jgi:hypothetical protein
MYILLMVTVEDLSPPNILNNFFRPYWLTNQQERERELFHFPLHSVHDVGGGGALSETATPRPDHPALTTTLTTPP